MIRKYLIAICVLVFITGCKSKSSLTPEMECNIQRDQLIATNTRIADKLNALQVNINQQVRIQTESKTKELNSKIESYNNLTTNLLAQEDSYRQRLRIILWISLSGIVLALVAINFLLIKRFFVLRTNHVEE